MKHNLLAGVFGAFDVFAVAIDAAILFALFPAIKGFIGSANANMTATEQVLAALIPLALVLGFVYVVWHQVKGGKKH